MQFDNLTIAAIVVGIVACLGYFLIRPRKQVHSNLQHTVATSSAPTAPPNSASTETSLLLRINHAEITGRLKWHKDGRVSSLKGTMLHALNCRSFSREEIESPRSPEEGRWHVHESAVLRILRYAWRNSRKVSLDGADIEYDAATDTATISRANQKPQTVDLGFDFAQAVNQLSALLLRQAPVGDYALAQDGNSPVVGKIIRFVPSAGPSPATEFARADWRNWYVVVQEGSGAETSRSLDDLRRSRSLPIAEATLNSLFQEQFALLVVPNDGDR